MTLTVYKIDK